MSPKKPVEKLSILCLKSKTKILVEAIKSNGEKSVKELQEYFDGVPLSLCDEILTSVMDLTPLSSQSKWITFSVFDYRCSKLDCRKLSQKYHELFFNKIRYVQHLNLTEVQIQEKSLIDLLERLQEIRSLVIPSLVTDQVLKTISSLNKISFLDISGESLFSPHGLRFLTNKTLLILSIGMKLSPSIANTEGYGVLASLLGQLPNLEEIRTFEYTGRGIRLLESGFVTKLKAISDCYTDLENIRAMIKACPCVEEITLHNPDNDVFGWLENFRNLRRLKVNKLCESTINLSVKTLSLEHVEVKNVCMDFNNLCPTIEVLNLTRCKVTALDESNLSIKNLHTFELIDCDIAKSIVVSLLRNCKNIRRLAVSNEIGLTDHDIKNLCQKQHLKKLEELWLSLARNLTSDSVILLMNHCDKLKLIGTLNGWKVEKVEVNYLRCVIYFTNTKLNLLYFSCF